MIFKVMEINTIEGLRDSLSKPKDLICKGEGQFENLAKALMNNFQIQKGENRYWMTDIEFYVYTDSHRDIITYPRNCKAGMWFFHQSGVDISFESEVDPEARFFVKKPELATTSVFGGILIRGIVMEGNPSINPDGPIKVCDELFEKFDAFGNPVGFPQIVPASKARGVTPTQATRYGRPIKDYVKKVKGILVSNYDRFPPGIDFVSEFKEYWEKGLYRFKA